MSIELSLEEGVRWEAIQNDPRIYRVDTRVKLYELWKVKKEHPEYSAKQLRMATGASKLMVTRFRKFFLVEQLLEWDEVMQ